MSTSLLEILAGVKKMRAVENSAQGYVGNLKLYVNVVAAVCKQWFHLMGKSLDQEPLRFMAMFAASGG